MKLLNVPELSSEGFAWSDYQTALFDFVRRRTESLMVGATAGSGKTVSLVEAVNRSGARDSIFLAYSRAIARTLRHRMPGRNCRTYHSLGFQVLRNYCPDVLNWKNPDERKTGKILKELVDSWHRWDERRDLVSAFWMDVVRAAEAVKQTMLRPPLSVERLASLCRFHGIYPGRTASEFAECAAVVDEVLRRSVHMARTEGVIDFADMIWMPVVLNWKFPKVGTLWVDEVQDVSDLRLEAMRRQKPDRVIATGDRNQSIMGFAGAFADSFDRVKAEFSAEELPLPISYRCPRAVVELAQRLVPSMQAAPGAPLGVVEDLGRDRWHEDDLLEGDMVLCRNNAPLTDLFYRLWKANRPCSIMGSRIGRSILSLIKRCRAQGDDRIEPLREGMQAFLEKETKRLERRIREKDDRKAVWELDRLTDRVLTALVVVRHCKAQVVPDLIREVKRVFSGDTMYGIRLSTVHKAKGLEADRVWIYEPGLMPSPKAKQDWEFQQERNLQYVAWTRAKRELRTFSSGGSY